MEAGHDASTLPLLDPAFVPVSAIVCGVDWLIRRDGGTDLVATEEHAIDAAALEAVLRLPVLTPPAGNYACRLDLPSVGWLAVVDASGRWVRPGAPTDECGRIDRGGPGSGAHPGEHAGAAGGHLRRRGACRVQPGVSGHGVGGNHPGREPVGTDR